MKYEQDTNIEVYGRCVCESPNVRRSYGHQATLKGCMNSSCSFYIEVIQAKYFGKNCEQQVKLFSKEEMAEILKATYIMTYSREPRDEEINNVLKKAGYK